jgi:restriction endonuclease Mrr
MAWHEFEPLLIEGFRRYGYLVERGDDAAAGEAELILRKGSKTVLVQCWHWRQHEVGIESVEELQSVMVSHGADGALVVTTGTCTDEVQSFCADKPIGLINGDALLELMRAAKDPKPRVEPFLGSAQVEPEDRAQEPSAPRGRTRRSPETESA